MQFTKNDRLLVVAPHPDDEIFGCAGLMHRVKEVGGSVHVLYLTVGTTKDFSKKGVSTADERMKEIEAVAKLMRIDSYRVAFHGDEYHLKLDALPQIRLVSEIERGDDVSLQTLKPTIFAFPSLNDYNQDHRAANRASITATRPVPDVFKYTPPMILEYELPYFDWATTERTSANLYLSLDEKALAKKKKALSLYATQMKVKKGPISEYGAETLARMRGVLSGADAAEAFVLRRLVM